MATVTHSIISDVTKTTVVEGANTGAWYRFGQSCLHGCMPQNFYERYVDNSDDAVLRVDFADLVDNLGAADIIQYLDLAAPNLLKTSV